MEQGITIAGFCFTTADWNALEHHTRLQLLALQPDAFVEEDDPYEAYEVIYEDTTAQRGLVPAVALRPQPAQESALETATRWSTPSAPAFELFKLFLRGAQRLGNRARFPWR